MCELSIEIINKKIEDELMTIIEQIDDISDISIHIQKLLNNDIEPSDCLSELKYIMDDLTKSLKIIKRLRLLRTKSDEMESNTEKFKMYVNNPENITSDDEEEWREEEFRKCFMKIFEGSVTMKHDINDKINFSNL